LDGYITDDRKASRAEVVGDANNRCNQENLIEQLKNGIRAMCMSVDNRISNWVYIVMASLAWNLKAGKIVTEHKFGTKFLSYFWLMPTCFAEKITPLTTDKATALRLFRGY